jgi:hypothetical protein
MNSEQRWALINQYRRQFGEFECTCGKHSVTLQDDTGEPVLRCFWCGTLIHPGLDFYRQLEDKL